MKLTLLGMIAMIAVVILTVLIASHDWERALAENTEQLAMP